MKCKCGTIFVCLTKHYDSYQKHKYNKFLGPFLLEKMTMCDNCIKEKVKKAFKRLPEILKIISEDIPE